MCKEISASRDEPPADADLPPAALGPAPADVCHRKSGAPDERERIQRRVQGFNWKKSGAWLHLSFIYGPKLNQAELISIAELCSQKLHIKLDRDARRRKTVILKWFTEHWRQIHPLLRLIVLDE
jgi:hypothetical protein